MTYTLVQVDGVLAGDDVSDGAALLAGGGLGGLGHFCGSVGEGRPQSAARRMWRVRGSGSACSKRYACCEGTLTVVDGRGGNGAVDVEVRSSQRIENFGRDADSEVVWASLAYACAAKCRSFDPCRRSALEGKLQVGSKQCVHLPSGLYTSCSTLERGTLQGWIN